MKTVFLENYLRTYDIYIYIHTHIYIYIYTHINKKTDSPNLQSYKIQPKTFKNIYEIKVREIDSTNIKLRN